MATSSAPQAPAVDPAQVAVAASQARTEHDELIREHRREVKQRNRVKRETAQQRVAELRARHAAAVAARPPDPNRPPPDLTPLKLRPGLVHAPRATASE